MFIDMQDGYSDRDELLGNQLRAMTLLRLALAAHEHDPVIGFPARLERFQSLDECRPETATSVVHAAVWVVAGRIVGPPSQLVTHEHILDVALSQARSQRLA